MEISQRRTYWPTIDWKEAAPQETGMDQLFLERMWDTAEEQLPGLSSLLIARHGNLIFERYAQAFTRNDTHYLASITKSVISALVGIALQRGALQHLDQTLAEVFPVSLLSHVEPSKQTITLRSLLTNTSGMARDGLYSLQFDVRKNFVQAALEFPLVEKTFHYNSNGPHILLYLLSLVTHMSIAELVQRQLFQPLGIATDGQWNVTDQGWYPGLMPVGRLFMKPRDMLKIGYLYLNGGFWEDQQIIPTSYVADSISQHNEGGPPLEFPYGYCWWVTLQGPDAAFFAAGLGGQRIYIVPWLDLVVVTTASIEHLRENPQQEKEIHSLVSRTVLSAILNKS